MNAFEFGVNEQFADRLSLVLEIAELADGLVVPFRQVGVRLLQFLQKQGTDGFERVVRLRGSVPQGHQFVEFIKDGLRRVPLAVTALFGRRGVFGMLAEGMLFRVQFHEPAAARPRIGVPGEWLLDCPQTLKGASKVHRR